MVTAPESSLTNLRQIDWQFCLLKKIKNIVADVMGIVGKSLVYSKYEKGPRTLS